MSTRLLNHFSAQSTLKRLPILPFVPSPRPLICAVLDSCILWLRHNLHKRLETSLYLYVVFLLRNFLRLTCGSRTCVRTCHRTIWFLQKEHIRPGMSSSPRLLQLLMRSRLSLATTLEGNHWAFGLPRRQIGGAVIDCGHRTTAPGGVL